MPATSAGMTECVARLTGDLKGISTANSPQQAVSGANGGIAVANQRRGRRTH